MQFIVLSKPGCIYCSRAIDLLQSKALDHDVRVLDPQSDTYRVELESFRTWYSIPSSHVTFPIIIEQTIGYIGGFIELQHFLTRSSSFEFDDDF